MHPMDQIDRALEREEAHLAKMLDEGIITDQEYNQMMQEAQREARAEARAIAEEAAEEAYRGVLDGW